MKIIFRACLSSFRYVYTVYTVDCMRVCVYASLSPTTTTMTTIRREYDAKEREREREIKKEEKNDNRESSDGQWLVRVWPVSSSHQRG